MSEVVEHRLAVIAEQRESLVRDGVDEDKRPAAIGALSRVMGVWWRDVSNGVLPSFKARGELS